MAAPLPPSRYQYCDANGVPLAGGTIATYIYGTSTPKDTWADQNEGALNTNPVVLDASGRCSMFGDGEYRLVLHDADGNLIWDTYATTLVSAAMQPVVDAATLADARDAMGITDAIDAAVAVETTRAEAAESALSTAISNETARAETAEAGLSAAITAETARAEAAEAALSSSISGLGSNIAEANTVMQATTSVSITTHGGPVRVTAIGSPGITVDPATNLFSAATGTISRDGVTIGMMGYNAAGGSLPEAPSCVVTYQAATGIPPAILQFFYPTNPVIPLDRPAAGAHTYQVDYYIDPLLFPAPGEWAATFQAGAWCYLLVEEL